MLPYLKLQALYVAMAGLMAAAAHLGIGMLFRRHPLLRYLFSGGLLCAGSVALVILGSLVLPKEFVSSFSIVALVFYSVVIWLPLFSIAASFRKNAARGLGLWVAHGIAVGSLVIAFVALFIEPNRLVEREDHVLTAEWSEDSEPLLIAHISDLQTVGACARELEAVQRINAARPDFVVITGDYIAGPFWDSEPAVQAARRFLSSLDAKRGVIVVMGHSERESDRDRIFEGLDLIYLVNEEHRVDLGDGRSLSFHGIHSWPERESFRTLERPREPGEVRLCVSHVPDISAELDGLEVDLHLAGHTHGGQIVVPGFGPPITLSHLPRRYSRGLHRFGDHWLNVSAGIGMEGNHAPRIRLFCPPEISFLHLEGGMP